MHRIKLTIVLLFFIFEITTIQKEVTAQQVLDNEIFSKNNNADNYNINDSVSKPLVHVSITGTGMRATKLEGVTVMI